MGGDNFEQDDIGAEVERVVRRHDEATSGMGLWIGAEPTFTDRHSQAAEWVAEGVGDDKDARARRFIDQWRRRWPGAVVIRALGRKYAREAEPRFCYGVLGRRDGQPIWSGPIDRLQDGSPDPAQGEYTLVKDFRARLTDALRAVGWSTTRVGRDGGGTVRLVCRSDGADVDLAGQQPDILSRASIHAPTRGSKVGGDDAAEEIYVDTMAPGGDYLVLIHAGHGGPEHNVLWLELPAFRLSAELLLFLSCVQTACAEAGVDSLGLRGFPPPVDEQVAWTTLTPDPAVLEINQAPEPTMAAFLAAQRQTFELAAEVGLSPYRLYYNGDAADSGGGGQVTFGGPSPQESPFFRCPQLLPRLIRYVTAHPALSYWFATRYVGPSSQSPRADEGVRDRFIELSVALEHLADAASVTPEVLWSSLRHFLADASGNPHRSELNIEKLHNPYLPGRGLLGLVELRALSMAPSVEEAVVRALLLRGVVAMLMRKDMQAELVHWGDTLHDRFSLPYYLRGDLRKVMEDLEAAGLGLGPQLRALLLRGDRALAEPVELQGATLRIEQGVEFWPLLGDVASQEGGGSRLVDASTVRVQVELRAESAAQLQEFELAVAGFVMPLRQECEGKVRVMGVRYRSFKPNMGLHPLLPAAPPLVIELRHRSRRAVRVTLHPWRPDGGAYDGLPRDLADARARRFQRAVVETLPAGELSALPPAPDNALTPHCFDLRRVKSGQGGTGR